MGVSTIVQVYYFLMSKLQCVTNHFFLPKVDKRNPANHFETLHHDTRHYSSILCTLSGAGFLRNDLGYLHCAGSTGRICSLLQRGLDIRDEYGMELHIALCYLGTGAKDVNSCCLLLRTSI